MGGDSSPVCTFTGESVTDATGTVSTNFKIDPGTELDSWPAGQNYTNGTELHFGGVHNRWDTIRFYATNTQITAGNFEVLAQSHMIQNLNTHGDTLLGNDSGDHTTVAGDLTVNGTTTLNGSVNIGNGPVVFGQYDNNNGERVLFRDGLTSYGNVTVSGNTQLQNHLFVNRDTTLGNDSNDIVTIKGPATLENNLTVNGNTTLGNSTSDTITFAGVPKLPVFTTLPNTGTLGQMIIYQSTSGAQYLKVWIRTPVGLGALFGSPEESWMSVLLK